MWLLDGPDILISQECVLTPRVLIGARERNSEENDKGLG